MISLFKRKDKASAKQQDAQTTQPLTVSQLSGFEELANLSPAQYASIVNKQAIRVHAQDAEIDDVDDKTHRVFLLEGSVRIRSFDGVERELKATEYVKPLSLNHGYGKVKSVRTLEAAKTFRVPNVLFDAMDKLEAGEGYADTGIHVEEVNEDTDSAFGSALAERIFNDAKNGNLSLPTLPEIALSVRRAVADPDSSVESVAKIIQADISITARLIQIANGPFYRGFEPVTSCQGAVARVGLKTAKEIVTSLSLKNVFSSDDPRLKKQFSALWRHSTLVAAISAVLAKMTGTDSERAMLAGLMHDIGALVVIQHIGSFDPISYTEDDVVAAMKRLRGDLGAAVLKDWHFDADMVTVASEVESYHRDSGPEIDLCDIVQVAQVHAFFGTEEAAGIPSLESMASYQKLPLAGLGPDGSIQLLHEARDDIAEVLTMLR